MAFMEGSFHRETVHCSGQQSNIRIKTSTEYQQLAGATRSVSVRNTLSVTTATSYLPSTRSYLVSHDAAYLYFRSRRAHSLYSGRQAIRSEEHTSELQS